MRTNKKDGKFNDRRPNVKSLKIQLKIRFGKYRDSKDVPEIKLCGNWLSKLGFHHGRRVLVTTMNELLIIRL